MLTYVVRRIIQAIPVLFFIAVVSFFLMQQAPGGPQAAFNQNPHITPQQVNAWLARWCLERDPGVLGTIREYAGWLGLWNCQGGGFLSAQGLPNFLPTFLGGGVNGILHGDFGYSITSGQPVLQLILQRLPATLILMVTAWILWVSIAMVTGVTAAVRRYSFYDQAVTFISYVLYSLPTFWLGLILIFIFGVTLRWFPTQGIIDVRSSPAPFGTDAYWTAFFADPLPQVVDIGRHLVLPVVTLISVSIAADSRFVRAAMLDRLGAQFVRTARAKGLPGRVVVFRHAFRNALVPVITVIGLEVALLMGGAVLTETTFNWPGIGHALYIYLENRDYAAVQGIVIVFGLVVVASSLVVDFISALIDPRMRYK